jgi:hypothetical protein
LKQIHDAQRERIVRPDDGEFDFLFLREREQPGKSSALMLTHSTARHFWRAFLCDAGVAGRAPHLRDVRRLRQFPNQRVFASARTDDQNFHTGTISLSVFADIRRRVIAKNRESISMRSLHQNGC